MAVLVPTLACCPPPAASAFGSSAGSSCPIGGRGCLGEGRPQSQVPPARVPQWTTCWHGESCPWHAQRRCFWWHDQPAPSQPLVSGPTASPLAASVAALEAKVFATTTELGVLAAEVSVLDVKVGKALACEVLDLELKATSRDSQLQSLVADMRSHFDLELGVLRDRLAGNASEVHGLASAASSWDGALRAALLLVEEKAELHVVDLRLKYSDVTSELACTRVLLERTVTCSDLAVGNSLGDMVGTVHTDFLALPGRNPGKDVLPKTSSGPPPEAQLEEQLPLISGDNSPTSSASERRLADLSSSLADDEGGGGFHGVGGGGGVADSDEPAPPCVPDSLSHAEIARRFSLLPESVQGGDSAVVMAAILSMGTV